MQFIFNLKLKVVLFSNAMFTEKYFSKLWFEGGVLSDIARKEQFNTFVLTIPYLYLFLKRGCGKEQGST
jgi:hypothetical protein